MKTLLLSLIITLSTLLAVCSTASAGESVTLTFLPPKLDGRYSMGIYNSSGHLVRTLHQDAPESAFVSGLNGLITQWDGSDDKGNRLPPGEYVARGVIVGNGVAVRGEAFHFNDWVGREDIPPIQTIVDFRMGKDRDTLIVADTLSQGRILGRINNESGFLWIQSIAADSQIVTINSTYVFLKEKDTWMARHLSDGSIAGSIPIDLSIGAATDDDLFVFNKKTTQAFRLVTTEDRLVFKPDTSLSGSALPFDIDFASGFSNGWWTGNSQAKVVLHAPQHSQTELSLTPLHHITKLSAGNNQSLWVLGSSHEEKNPVIAQFNNLEEAQHVLTSDPSWIFTNMTASHTQDALLVEENNGNEVRVRFLSHDDAPDNTSATNPKSHWKIDWEKVITPCINFGIVNGMLLANATGKVDPNLIKMALEDNPLEPDKKPSILLSAQVTPEGSWLTTSDGLPLVRVSAQPHLQKGVIAKGTSPGAARFYQGNGTVVEEFRITGLEQMATFDAGSFELP